MLNIFKLLIVLIFLLVGASFATMNNNLVVLDIYFVQTEAPLSLIMLLTLGSGIILGGFFSLFLLFRLKRENKHLKKQNQLAQQEVKNLRAIPLNDR